MFHTEARLLPALLNVDSCQIVYMTNLVITEAYDKGMCLYLVHSMPFQVPDRLARFSLQLL
jgi:hypothetical protein